VVVAILMWFAAERLLAPMLGALISGIVPAVRARSAVSHRHIALRQRAARGVGVTPMPGSIVENFYIDGCSVRRNGGRMPCTQVRSTEQKFSSDP
jgi:hypothetical protein